LNTCKLEIQQPVRYKTVDNKSKEEIYAAWNVRGIIDKEVELNEVLRYRHIKIAVISETKRKLQGNKDTRNCSIT
jgi:hypothetical protein